MVYEKQEIRYKELKGEGYEAANETFILDEKYKKNTEEL